MEERRLNRTLQYFGEFYEIINDSGKTRRAILRKCRQVFLGGRAGRVA